MNFSSSGVTSNALLFHSGEYDWVTAWCFAPDEQSPDYFRVFSAVSQTIQRTLRGWTRDWFTAHPEVLERPGVAFTFLVYLAAGVYPGRPENEFTYDVQQSDALRRAFRTAARGIQSELKKLNTMHLSWLLRERYFPYRGKQIVAFVEKKHRALFAMFQAETAIMDDLLRFAVIESRSGNPKAAAVALQKSIALRLRRFSQHTLLGSRAGDLLKAATCALEEALEPDASFTQQSCT